jgi:hypothetical protein
MADASVVPDMPSATITMSPTARGSVLLAEYAGGTVIQMPLGFTDDAVTMTTSPIAYA